MASSSPTSDPSITFHTLRRRRRRRRRKHSVNTSCVKCQLVILTGFLSWAKGNNRELFLPDKFPWSRKWQPTPVFSPGKSCRQRSLVGNSPWGHKELDMTEATKQPPDKAQPPWLCACSGWYRFKWPNPRRHKTSAQGQSSDEAVWNSVCCEGWAPGSWQVQTAERVC